jgi:uncharacterized damage-inducible protein DinB
MITPSFVRTMAAYNRDMNERVYSAAARLGEEERTAERGVFWSSIHGTLAHLLWADRMQMSRLAGWPVPAAGVEDSASADVSFSQLAEERRTVDAGISGWAEGVTAADLEGELHWYSGAKQRQVTTSRALLVVHMFNHQTHHRGQVHALLTRAGASTGDTDLWILVDTPR